MEKFRRAIFWTILVSETSHVFCCVLPVLISALSLLGSLGVASIMPSSLLAVHNFLHAYELPVIAFSALLLAVGWILHRISIKIDCHDSGCGHPPCAPQKKKTSLILLIATVLFLFNTAIYFALHYHNG